MREEDISFLIRNNKEEGEEKTHLVQYGLDLRVLQEDFEVLDLKVRDSNALNEPVSLYRRRRAYQL